MKKILLFIVILVSPFTSNALPADGMMFRYLSLRGIPGGLNDATDTFIGIYVDVILFGCVIFQGIRICLDKR